MLPDQDQILAELTQIIRDVLELPELAVSAATNAENIEEWDSFNQINIIVAVEAKFGIRFKTAEFEALRNVGALASLVREKLMLRARADG
jgi:acyl carrier protein